MLNPILTPDQFAKLDTVLQAEYKVREDGSYVLDVAKQDGFELTNTRSLLATVSATRAERDTMDRELREMRTQLGDSTIEELRAAKKRLAEITAEGGGNTPDAAALRQEIEAQLRKDFERQTATLSESHQAALTERENRLAQLSTQLDERIFTDAARDAILAVDKDAEPLFLLPEIQRRSRIVERDGKRTVEVLNSEGQVEYVSEDGKAVPKGLRHVVEDLKSDPRFGRAFSGGNASGSGTSPTSGTAPAAKVANPWDRTGGSFSLKEQARILREDPPLAAKLKAEAPKMVRRSMLPEGAKAPQ